jgi:hypothetical protein
MTKVRITCFLSLHPPFPSRLSLSLSLSLFFFLLFFSFVLIAILGDTRSGVILFRVEDRLAEKNDGDAENVPEHEPFKMTVTWDDLSGIRNKDVQTLTFSSTSTTSSTTSSTITSSATTSSATPTPVAASYYENTGVRKAILLVRYTDFFKKYLEMRLIEATKASMADFQVQ